MRRSSRPRADDGFSLLETIVAVGIIGTLMASAIVFFVGSQASMRRQAELQGAVQLAAGSMDYVTQLRGTNVLLGRTEADVRDQAQDHKVPGVEAYFDDAQLITDLDWQRSTDPAPPSLQTLPTTADPITVSGIATPYQRWWYVGKCWQKRTGDDCLAPDTVPAESVEMFRVVVAITWPSPQCPGDQCQYVAAMLTEVDPGDPTWK